MSATARPAGPEAEAPSALVRWRDRDHTRGNLFASLAVLSLPLITTSLFGGVIFQLGDLKLISAIGEDAMTSVIVTNQSWRQIFFMLVMGASFGAQGMISRFVGAGDTDRAEHVAGQVVTMGLLFSATLAVLGVAFARPMLGALNVSPQVLEVGLPYFRLVFLFNFGFVFIFLFNAILNGAGDTTTPMFIAILQTIVALSAEFVLIRGAFGLPGLGVSGAALGVAVGQMASIALIFAVLLRGRARIRLRRRHMRPDWPVMKSIALMSWPPALQMLGGFLVTIFFIRLMGDFGDKAQTAYSIGLRLGMVGPMVAFPIAGAAATLVGQNLGARNVPRAWQALGAGLAVHVTLMWSMAAALYVFREPFLRLFTEDPEVITLGSELLLYQCGSFALLAFYFVFFRTLQAAGDVFVPMAISIGGALVLTLPLGLYLSLTLEMGPSGVFIAGLVSTVVSTIATGAWLATGRWTRLASPDAADRRAPSRTTRQRLLLRVAHVQQRQGLRAGSVHEVELRGRVLRHRLERLERL